MLFRCAEILCFSASQSSHCCFPALYTMAFLIRYIFVPAVFACASVWAVSNHKQLSEHYKHLFLKSGVVAIATNASQLRKVMLKKQASSGLAVI